MSGAWAAMPATRPWPSQPTWCWDALLAALPPPYAAMVLALSGFLLGTYAALFAGWFFFI